jgi:hypothetical protein
MGELKYSRIILDLETKGDELQAPEALSLFLLDIRVGGPQNRFGRCEVPKNLLPLPGNEALSL